MEVSLWSCWESGRRYRGNAVGVIGVEAMVGSVQARSCATALLTLHINVGTWAITQRDGILLTIDRRRLHTVRTGSPSPSCRPSLSVMPSLSFPWHLPGLLDPWNVDTQRSLLFTDRARSVLQSQPSPDTSSAGALFDLIGGFHKLPIG